MPSFRYASAYDPLDAYTLEQIAIGVATRKYRRTLDPLPDGVAERAISKSAVSRRFVALTSNTLTTWMPRPSMASTSESSSSTASSSAITVILLVLGLDSQGVKHVLGLREGTTENATVCKGLLADLRQRGLDLDRPMLFIIEPTASTAAVAGQGATQMISSAGDRGLPATSLTPDRPPVSMPPVTRGVGWLVLAASIALSCSHGPRADPLAGLRRGMLAGSNLLVVTLDTTRADRLGCYGAKDAVTPVIDRLAADGLRVEHAIAPVPVTLPSHASLFTGLDPTMHGVRMNAEFRLAPEHTTLAEILAGHGWETAAFVSAFVLDERFGLAQGFATYDDAMPPPEATVFPAGTVERSARLTTNAAIAWLERRTGPAPFFVWVHYFDAHAPYAPPADLATRFADRPYDGEIASVDRELGRLLDAVQARGGRTATLVVGDHGESLGEHGELTHGVFLYDATVRVPMILRLPDGAARGVVGDRVVSLVDVVPTLLDLHGIAGPEPGDGVSLVGTAPDPARAVYLESLTPYLDFGWAPLHALRRRDDKYVAAPRPEYYDLRSDPREVQPRAPGEPPARALAAALERRLAAAPYAVRAAATLHAPTTPRGNALEAAARERLEALGYLAGAGADPTGARADPKDMIRIANAAIEANAALAAGDAERARTLLEPIAAEHPRDRSILHALAKVYLRLERTRDAEKALRAVTTIRPKADVSLLLAQIVLLDGRIDEASRWLDQAARLEPEHGGIEIARGDLALASGRPDEARGHYRRAAEIDPSRAAGTAAARLAKLPSG